MFVIPGNVVLFDGRRLDIGDQVFGVIHRIDIPRHGPIRYQISAGEHGMVWIDEPEIRSVFPD
jgi:hypothetical protein